MLREAELFVMAEDMLVEVLGRIRDQDLGIVLPPLSDLPHLSDQPRAGDTLNDGNPMSEVVASYAYDDACVPGVLAGGAADEVDRADLDAELDAGRSAAVARIAADAVFAARAITDGDVTLHARYGDVPAREYLLRLTVNRSLVAHYVAAYLGSSACPLPEELARPLWELTAPDAQRWREQGIFGAPTPIPDQASWRDTFLRTAGHEPHPLGH